MRTEAQEYFRHTELGLAFSARADEVSLIVFLVHDLRFLF